MLDDDSTAAARAVWRSQNAQGQVPPLAALRARAHEYARAGRQRVLLEYISAAAAAAVCVWVLVTGEGLLLRTGVLAALAGVLLSLHRWRRIRAGWSLELDAGAADGLQFYKQELARMREVHRGMWKSLPPLLPGVALLIGWAMTQGNGHGDTHDMIGLVVAIGAWIGVMLWREEREARRYERELRELEQAERTAP